jgi:hypothetical protein
MLLYVSLLVLYPIYPGFSTPWQGVPIVEPLRKGKGTGEKYFFKKVEIFSPLFYPVTHSL